MASPDVGVHETVFLLTGANLDIARGCGIAIATCPRNAAADAMVFEHFLRACSAISCLVFLAGCSASGTSKPATSAYGAPKAVFDVCSGYSCVLKDRLVLTKRQVARLERILKTGRKNPSAERKAIRKAIGTMERYAAANLRFPKDPKMANPRYNGRRGFMDCVDESLNTTAYLQYFAKRGWLKHHKPRRYYAERGLLVDGRYPHKSAVMIQNDGTGWTVDSWYLDNGSPPDIIKLKRWKRSKGRQT